MDKRVHTFRNVIVSYLEWMNRDAVVSVQPIEDFRTLGVESDERMRSRPNDCIETQIFLPLEDKYAFSYNES